MLRTFVCLCWIIAVCCGIAGSTVSPAPSTRTRRAWIAAIDGLAGDALDVAIRAGTAPTFAALASTGSYAPCSSVFDERCCKAQSGPKASIDYSWVTASGWTSVLTGVDTPKHQVANNDVAALMNFFTTSQTYPTVLKMAHDANLSTAASGVPTLLTACGGDGSIRDTLMSLGVLDFECGLAIGGEACTKTSTCNLDYRAVTQDLDFAEERVQLGDTHLLLTHFDEVDEAGHGPGWRSEEYYRTVSAADARVGQLLQAIQEAALRRDEEWLVVVTADHGGTNSSHSVGVWDDVVPLIVAVVNSDVELQPIKLGSRQFDAAPTVLKWLGLPQPEAGMDGQVQGLPSDGSNKDTAVEEPRQFDMISIGVGCLLGALAFAGTVALYRRVKQQPGETDVLHASVVPGNNFIQLSQEPTTAIECALRLC